MTEVRGTTLALLGGLAGVAVSLSVTVLLLDGRSGPGQAVQETAIRTQRLERRLKVLEERLTRVESRSELAAPSAGSSRIPLVDVGAEVRRWLDENGAQVLDGTGTEEASTDGAEPARIDDLLAADLSMAERASLLRELAEEGLLEGAVGELERMAEVDPQNAAIQMALGQALIQRIQEVEDGELAGELAARADAAFAQVLEADPQHWDARFEKASALTYWPETSGKQAEALEHLELIVKQGPGTLPEAKSVQAHVLLGNLLLKQGDLDQALQTWSAGLGAHPGNQQLQDLIELHGKY